jgi:hypothetical protein
MLNYEMSGAIIVTGPSGCGKSHWIQAYAKEKGRQLFVCPCRKDRTLRDGRQKLHIWGRRTEPAILWLEGADDLTPEAQAFLRRILETHAPQVQFILECRDSSRLQEPIRSRCTLHRINQPTWDQLVASVADIRKINMEEIREYLLPHEYSYRRINHCIDLMLNLPDLWIYTRDHRIQERVAIATADGNKIPEYMLQGYNPEALLYDRLQNEGTNKLLLDYGECLERSGSLWAFLGYAL